MSWIKIEKGCKMPRKGKPVDLWHSEFGRLPDYELVKDYYTKGNNFFQPNVCGPSCIRYDKDELLNVDIWWMYPPPPPTNS